MSMNMILIPGDNDTAMMGCPVAASPANEEGKSKEESTASPSPRRVSFRIDEVDIAQEIAKSVGVDDYYDEEENDNEGTAQDENNNDEATLISPPAAGGPLNNTATTTSEEFCTRGLELKRTPKRQKRKFTIIKSIVRNQRQANTKTLAKLATICNSWAADAARTQAEWDYQDAYQHQHQHVTTERRIRELPDMDRYPMPFKKKKDKKRLQDSAPSSSSSGDHHQSSCKRIKTC